MRMFNIPKIAIVGCGLTGAAAVIELLRKLTSPFDLLVIEPEERLGRGIAYGRADSFHLLNVRAGKLGIRHGEPNDFAVWARGRSFGIRPPPEPSEPTRAFLSRQLFGTYVEARLNEGIASRPDVSFTHVRAEAKRIRRSASGYEIAFERQPPITAQIVVLATGYGRRSAAGRFGRLPFGDLDPQEVRGARSALFVGTGLSFVDEFLRLRSRGFRGRALAVSRHGLLPQTHRANEAPRPLGRIEADVGRLFREFRAAMQTSEPPGSAAVDLILGLRGDLQPLWQALDVRHQSRFLRHLMPYWSIARHRMPPEIQVQVAQSMKGGMLRIAAGRVSDADGHPRVRLAGGESVDSRFDLVFDCTGHRALVASPVIGSLVRQGLARVDPHGMGLSVADDGALIDRHGVRRRGLFALGPLGQGTLFEITAVPEIVAQCAAMASGLDERFRHARAAGRIGLDLHP
jgi:uncharacterized NAD(P)/FAD-binding protein YdhS